MPRLPFIPENKVETTSDFPKLKFDMGEKKRVLCVEEPVFTYTHTLRAPKIVDGRSVSVTAKRNDGSTYETLAMDFVGRPQCLGNLDVISQNGFDPDNCPICELAQESDQVSSPDRRFAMNVVVYATKQNSFDVQLPFSVRVVVWSFTDTTFNKLTDIATEWAGDGGLQRHDLLLGPCTNKDYQKFEISVSQKAAWLEDDTRKQLTVETFRENKAKGDLEEFAGRRVEKRWMQDDLQKIKTRWRIANGESPFEPEPAADSALLNQQSLTAGFDELLSGTSETSKPADASPISMADLLSAPVTTGPSEASPAITDLFTSQTADDAIAPVTVETQEVEVLSSEPTEEKTETPANGSESKKPRGEVVSFDDLLASFT